jgi:hypothetical protein
MQRPCDGTDLQRGRGRELKVREGRGRGGEARSLPQALGQGLGSECVLWGRRVGLRAAEGRDLISALEEPSG